MANLDLLQHQTASGSRPRISMLVSRGHAGQGKEPTYCMAMHPPSVLSRSPAHLL